MTEYVAVRLMRSFIDMLRGGARDLQNPDLAPYYAGPAVPASEVAGRLAAAQALASRVGGSLSSADYAAQAGEPTSAVFLSVVVGSGVELTFTDDFYESDPATQLPALGYRTSFSSGRGYDRAAVSAARLRAGVQSLPVQHLRQPNPPLLADADPYARVKIQRSKEFVRRYLSAS